MTKLDLFYPNNTNFKILFSVSVADCGLCLFLMGETTVTIVYCRECEETNPATL